MPVPPFRARAAHGKTVAVMLTVPLIGFIVLLRLIKSVADHDGEVGGWAFLVVLLAALEAFSIWQWRKYR